MAFIGVLISCDMLARKALLARLAASAASRARRRSSSASIRSVTSRTTPSIASGRPSGSRARRTFPSTVRREPSFRRNCAR